MFKDSTSMLANFVVSSHAFSEKGVFALHNEVDESRINAMSVVVCEHAHSSSVVVLVLVLVLVLVEVDVLVIDSAFWQYRLSLMRRTNSDALRSA